MNHSTPPPPNIQRVFIGYDSTQVVAYNVLKYSILKHTTKPTLIIPLILKDMPWFRRPHDPLQSTEFTYTRFLVPYLAHYSGLAVFMDCDMLCLSDISELFALPMDGLILRVRKHKHRPKSKLKMTGKTQTVYPRKNWSSLMLMDCAKLRNIWTPDLVEIMPPRWLHRMEAIPDNEIGDISSEWNVLDKYDKHTKLVHYTEGGPWLATYRNHKYGKIWFSYHDDFSSMSI